MTGRLAAQVGTWFGPGFAGSLTERCAQIAEYLLLLRVAVVERAERRSRGSGAALAKLGSRKVSAGAPPDGSVRRPRPVVRRSYAGGALLARTGRCCLGQPVLKEALFGLGLREVERAAVRVVGLIVPADATQEVGTRGVEVPVMVEVEAVEDGQAGIGSIDLGHGDGPVHLDDRGAGLLGERFVQGGDLPPVAGLVQVQVRDGRLEQVGPGAPWFHGPPQ